MKELRNFRQIAHWNRCLVQRKAVPKQCGYDITLEFNSYRRILFAIEQIVCYSHVLRTHLQFSLQNHETFKNLELKFGQKLRNY